MTHSLHRYPALYLGLALAAGVTAGSLSPVDVLPLCLATGAVLSIAALVSFRIFGDRLVSPAPLLATALVIVAALCIGAAGYLSRFGYAPADELARHFSSDPDDVTLVGRITHPPRRDSLRTVFTLEVDSLDRTGRMEPASGRVRMTIREAAPHLGAGQHIRVVARVTVPLDRRNPADFSYRTYLFRQGIRSIGAVPDRSFVRTVSPAGRADRALDGARRYILESLHRYVRDPQARGMVEAVLTGSRDHLDEERQQQLARTGLAHLLAVSGLHVFLVGMLLYRHLGPLLTRMRLGWAAVELTRGIATMVVLVAFTLLVGASPSVVRAVAMTATFLAGHLLQRPGYPINALCVSAVGLQIINPAVVFDAGFQLSFAAVAAIVLFVPSWQEALPAHWRAGQVRAWLVDMTLVSAAATLGTAPVLMHQFGQVALAGIVLNLPSIPASSLALASGILMVLASDAMPIVAAAFGAVAETSSQVILIVAAWGDRWAPWLNVALPLTHALPAAALVIGMAALYGGLAARWRWRSVLAALGLLAAHQMGMALRPPELSVIFFDVGQGDAALVIFPNGRTLLIDCGPADPYVDQGERTILPHLHRYGIRRIDDVLVTHPHGDHLGGLPALLRGVRIGRILTSGAVYESELVRAVDRLADSLAVPVRVLAAGDTLALDPAVRALVTGPAPALRTNDNVNEASVVLRIRYGGTRFLFTGDAEYEAERALVARYPHLLAAEVVKVGHHGSSTSSAPWFVPYVATTAGVAVVSVARRNRYGLPDEEVIARWPAHGMRLYQTSEEGAVWFVSDGQHVKRRDWRAE